MRGSKPPKLKYIGGVFCTCPLYPLLWGVHSLICMVLRWKAMLVCWLTTTPTNRKHSFLTGIRTGFHFPEWAFFQARCSTLSWGVFGWHNWRGWMYSQCPCVWSTKSIPAQSLGRVEAERLCCTRHIPITVTDEGDKPITKEGKSPFIQFPRFQFTVGLDAFGEALPHGAEQAAHLAAARKQ